MLHGFCQRFFPLGLFFKGAKLRFPDIAAFDGFCGSRVYVPSERLRELMDMSESDLALQLNMLRTSRYRLLECLLSVDLGTGTRFLEPRAFSKDNSWRDLISALQDATGPRYLCRAAGRVALLRYLQYLERREDSVALVLREHADSHDSHDPAWQGMATISEGDRAEIEELASEHSGSGPEQGLRPPAEIESMAASGSFKRLPRGMGVELELRPGESIKLLLSSHPCQLELRQELCFIDVSGDSHRLLKGRTSVGRDRVNEIVLDSTLRDVSRVHLVIEFYGPNRVQLFDYSSYGTYLPRNLEWRSAPGAARPSSQNLSSLH